MSMSTTSVSYRNQGAVPPLSVYNDTVDNTYLHHTNDSHLPFLTLSHRHHRYQYNNSEGGSDSINGSTSVGGGATGFIRGLSDSIIGSKPPAKAFDKDL